jgi:hypothetical protein
VVGILGIVGFTLDERDPTSALFLMLLGLGFDWLVGWIPPWFFVLSLMALAMLLATHFRGILKKD